MNKSLSQLESQVYAFNVLHKVGDKVTVMLDDGTKKECTVSSAATILGGHSAVVWLDEISGCYSLDRVVFN